jgi:hypothetical protein
VANAPRRVARQVAGPIRSSVRRLPHPSVLSLEGLLGPLDPAFQGCAQAEIMRIWHEKLTETRLADARS